MVEGGGGRNLPLQVRTGIMLVVVPIFNIKSQKKTVRTDSGLRFQVLTATSMMMEAVRTSETSVDNYFTRQYNPEDNSELLNPPENTFSAVIKKGKCSYILQIRDVSAAEIQKRSRPTII
jgi:hypothetical protein